MGLRFRKSINLGGGFRVNISTKGIGYSWGVKGYRITKTADGRTRQTASIPGTGISYVAEHGRTSNHGKNSSQQTQQGRLSNYSNIEQISSADVAKLRSGTYEDLFKRMQLMRFIRITAVIITILSCKIELLFALFLLATIILFCITRSKIEYEFDEVEQQKWDELSAAWRAVAKSKSLKEITMTAKSKNAKVTAGIENAIDVANMKTRNSLPWYIKTNVKPILFIMKSQQIAIMPDRLLVFSGLKFGALDYKDISFDLSAFGFVETDKVPKDSELIKYVWGYANKDGTADKRYANNKQFPVMKYGKFVITSPNGLNVQFICSNEKAADQLNQFLHPEQYR